MNYSENNQRNQTSNSTHSNSAHSNITTKQQVSNTHSSENGYVEPLPESSRPRRDGPGGDDAEI